MNIDKNANFSRSDLSDINVPHDRKVDTFIPRHDGKHELNEAREDEKSQHREAEKPRQLFLFLTVQR